MIERLSVDLRRERVERVRHAVADGEYESPSAVVDEALSLWEQARDREAIEELGQLIQKGVDSGLAPWEGAEALKAEFRRRRAAREAS